MLVPSLLNISPLAELGGRCPWSRELGDPSPGENRVPQVGAMREMGTGTFSSPMAPSL